MSISYFNCDTCGVEMNDCYCPIKFWWCSGCDTAYCDACVTGTWVSCRCSGSDYCKPCVAAGRECPCGIFETLRRSDPISRPVAPKRRRGRSRLSATERRYPEPKWRELTEKEKAKLRARIERGGGDIHDLAHEFGCSSSQVAGIKAAMHR